MLGLNCSTRASGAFVYAGILKGGIPGLDTPNNLYKQIIWRKKDQTTSHSGYIGFIPKSDKSGFDLVVESTT